MAQILVDENEKKISVVIPLTANSGKIRIKNRSILNEYGITFPTKQVSFKMSNYVEWMIGYDVVVREEKKLAESTLANFTHFIGANGNEKALYELSEIIYYFVKWGIVSREQLEEVAKYLAKIRDEDLIDENAQLKISRDNFSEKTINGEKYKFTLVKYPLLVREFGEFEIVSEIKITEQQRAMATQPMLYLCFPITELHAEKPLLGRIAETKEFAYFDITRKNVSVFLEILRTFGTLSRNHRHDVLEILRAIVSN